jgi:hypothetical protein
MQRYSTSWTGFNKHMIWSAISLPSFSLSDWIPATIGLSGISHSECTFCNVSLHNNFPSLDPDQNSKENEHRTQFTMIDNSFNHSAELELRSALGNSTVYENVKNLEGFILIPIPLDIMVRIYRQGIYNGNCYFLSDEAHRMTVCTSNLNIFVHKWVLQSCMIKRL